MHKKPPRLLVALGARQHLSGSWYKAIANCLQASDFDTILRLQHLPVTLDAFAESADRAASENCVGLKGSHKSSLHQWIIRSSVGHSHPCLLRHLLAGGGQGRHE